MLCIVITIIGYSGEKIAQSDELLQGYSPKSRFIYFSYIQNNAPKITFFCLNFLRKALIELIFFTVYLVVVPGRTMRNLVQLGQLSFLPYYNI